MRFIILLVFSLIAMLVIGETPGLPVEKEKRLKEIKSLLPLKVGDYKADGKD